MTRHASIESVESRRLFAVAAPNISFGQNGLSLVPSTAPTELNYADNRIVALADGRLIERKDERLRFLLDNGGRDSTRGVKGQVTLDADDLVAIESSTGRVARVRQELGVGTYTVELYNTKGRLSTTYTTPSDPDVTAQSITFTADGGVAILGWYVLPNDPDSPDRTRYHYVVRRLDRSLTPVAGFGIDGRVGDLNDTLITFGEDQLNAGPIIADAQGRLYLPFRQRTDHLSGETITEHEYVLRLTTAGSLDTTFGTDGRRTAYTESNGTFKLTSSRDPRTLERAFDRASGAYYVLWSVDVENEDESPNLLHLTRLDADGTSQTVTVGTETRGGLPDGRLAIGSDGKVHVATRGNFASVTHVYTYFVQGGKLQPLFTADPFGERNRTTQRFDVADMTIGRYGEVYLTGHAHDAAGKRTPGIYSVNGGTQYDYGSLSKPTELLGDGTLIVRGSNSRNDRISVTRKGDSLLITVNKAETLSFKQSDVRGILIKTGKGHDRVDVGSIGLGVLMEGGSGNDTLLGSNTGDDTIFGNSGNDQLEGRGRNDLLAGEDGDDLLLGGDEYDYLAGGNGNDRLYASGFARDVHSNDGLRDLLNGGAGADFIRRDDETDADNRDRLRGVFDSQDTVSW